MPLLKKTDLIENGETMTVIAGEFKGDTCTVLNKVPEPDTNIDHRRKIKVVVHTAHGDEEVYILPRMLDDGGKFATYMAQQHGGVVPGMVTPTTPPQPVAPVVTPVAPAPLPVVSSPVVSTRPVLTPAPVTDVDDPRLDIFRPDPKVVDAYISRTIPGRPKGESDVEWLLTFFDKRKNIMLVGDTQAGKTMLVEVLAVLAGRKRAKDRGDANWQDAKPLPIFTLSGSSGVTDFDLFGQTTAYNDGMTATEMLVWLTGLVALACQAGGILYLDEVNMMSERVTSSLHPVCDYRRHFVNRNKAVAAEADGTVTYLPEVVKANDDLWVVGTINPNYKGAGALNEAFTNRFQFIPWGYDKEVELRLVSYQTVRLIGDSLRAVRSKSVISTPIGSGTLAEVCRNTDDYGSETALWMLVSMFQPQEQPLVEEIITDRSFRTLLDSEREQKLSGTNTAPVTV